MDIDLWIKEFSSKLKAEFEEGILFIGLQGSYGRCEATDESDIDVVAIFQSLDIQILKRYRDITQSMPFSEKVCGFVCGREELNNWPFFELFHLYFDTCPVYGKLEDFIPFVPSIADAKDAVTVGIGGLYHGALHNYLFDENKRDILLNLYKSLFFILRAKYFAEYGEYIPSKKLLI